MPVSSLPSHIVRRISREAGRQNKVPRTAFIEQRKREVLQWAEEIGRELRNVNQFKENYTGHKVKCQTIFGSVIRQLKGFGIIVNLGDEKDLDWQKLVRDRKIRGGHKYFILGKIEINKPVVKSDFREIMQLIQSAGDQMEPHLRFTNCIDVVRMEIRNDADGARIRELKSLEKYMEHYPNTWLQALTGLEWAVGMKIAQINRTS